MGYYLAHDAPLSLVPPLRGSFLGIVASALAGAFLLTACAPRLSCREEVGVEVCERRECRDIATRRFVKCRPADAASKIVTCRDVDSGRVVRCASKPGPR